MNEPLSASAKTLICEIRKYAIQLQRIWATSVAEMSEAGSVQISCLTCERSREICLSFVSFGAKNTFPVGVREIKMKNWWGHVYFQYSKVTGVVSKNYFKRLWMALSVLEFIFLFFISFDLNLDVFIQLSILKYNLGKYYIKSLWAIFPL